MIDNLDDHTEGIVFDRVYQVAVSRLFRAWTDETQFVKWFGADQLPINASLDARTGGSWEVEFATLDGASYRIEGEYLEVIPDRLLEFTWRPVPPITLRQKVSSQSQVTVQFEPQGKTATRLRLVHRRVTDPDIGRGVRVGWTMSLDRLDKPTLWSTV